MTTEPKARLKLKEFEDRARAARDSWLKEQLKGTTLEDRVKKQLSESLNSMIWYIIGLEKRWNNEWSISRVNGREPAIWVEVQGQVRDRAAEIVRAALEDGGLPTLGKAQRDAIRKEYVDHLAYKARNLAGEQAARDANNVLDRVLQEMDEDTKPFCPVCQVRHLEPLHTLDSEDER